MNWANVLWNLLAAVIVLVIIGVIVTVMVFAIRRSWIQVDSKKFLMLENPGPVIKTATFVLEYERKIVDKGGLMMLVQGEEIEILLSMDEVKAGTRDGRDHSITYRNTRTSEEVTYTTKGPKSSSFSVRELEKKTIIAFEYPPSTEMSWAPFPVTRWEIGDKEGKTSAFNVRSTEIRIYAVIINGSEQTQSGIYNFNNFSKSFKNKGTDSRLDKFLLKKHE